jgi:hypothetical protein
MKFTRTTSAIQLESSSAVIQLTIEARLSDSQTKLPDRGVHQTLVNFKLAIYYVGC